MKDAGTHPVSPEFSDVSPSDFHTGSFINPSVDVTHATFNSFPAAQRNYSPGALVRGDATFLTGMIKFSSNSGAANDEQVSQIIQKPAAIVTATAAIKDMIEKRPYATTPERLETVLNGTLHIDSLRILESDTSPDFIRGYDVSSLMKHGVDLDAELLARLEDDLRWAGVNNRLRLADEVYDTNPSRPFDNSYS